MKRLIFTTCLVLLAVVQSWADGYTYYYFKGKMGGKITVELAFETFLDEEEGLAAGYILYPNAKHPAPILLVGYHQRDGFFHFSEYQPDGTVTGWLNFQVGGEDYADGPVILDGTWTNPKTEADYSLKTLKSPYDMARTQGYMPDWFVSPLEYESPDNLGRYYTYQQWNRNYKEMMGGHVELRGAGKNKVHFDICNVPQNIAEGSSEPGRPAVLNGPEFTYDNVNECGYGFKATFFKKFVVIESTTEYRTFECFGMGATFEGVYIKTKQ